MIGFSPIARFYHKYKFPKKKKKKNQGGSGKTPPPQTLRTRLLRNRTKFFPLTQRGSRPPRYDLFAHLLSSCTAPQRQIDRPIADPKTRSLVLYAATESRRETLRLGRIEGVSPRRVGFQTPGKNCISEKLFFRPFPRLSARSASERYDSCFSRKNIPSARGVRFDSIPITNRRLRNGVFN